MSQPDPTEERLRGYVREVLAVGERWGDPGARRCVAEWFAKEKRPEVWKCAAVWMRRAKIQKTFTGYLSAVLKSCIEEVEGHTERSPEDELRRFLDGGGKGDH